MKRTMRKLLSQTNDPALQADLQETRPFFLFLIGVLLFLYAISVYSDPALRQPQQLLPYTALFALHIALHWYMPAVTTTSQRLAIYLGVQLLLVVGLIFISRQIGTVIGLYLSLAGETIGILEDWRRGLLAALGYLALMALTYWLLWSWADARSWLGTAVLMLVLILFYVLLFLRQLNARARLQEAHTQLARYVQQVEMLTLENERERMARELHDTLAQGLAGLVLQLEALEATLELGRTAQALHITGQAKERARTALSEARRAIDDLRAADLSPADSIVREADRFQSATGIPCVLDMPVKLPLSARNGEHVVRCVAEGLTNIMRHARAAHAWVTLSIVRDRLHVEIRDDGKGFENTDGLPAGHYGLLGLRERARLAGGDLLITSTVGSGTTLHMTLPLQMEEAA